MVRLALRRKQKIEKRSKIAIRVGKVKIRIDRYDYYAIITSAFAGASIYLVLFSKYDALLQLGLFLSGWGFGSIMERLLR